MKIDKIDAEILKILNKLDTDNDVISPWGIMHHVYGKECDERKFSTIRDKMEKLIRYGIISINYDLDNSIELVEGTVKFGRTKFPDGKFKKTISIYIKEEDQFIVSPI